MARRVRLGLGLLRPLLELADKAAFHLHEPCMIFGAHTRLGWVLCLC